MVKPVISQLIEYGKTRRGWLGVRIQTVTDEIAESLGLTKAHGALVASVTPGGPAEKAKLKAGDIITEFDGKDVEDMRSLPRIVAETPIDKKTELKYWRDGKEHKAKVVIDRRGWLHRDAQNAKGFRWTPAWRQFCVRHGRFFRFRQRSTGPCAHFS